MSGEWPEGSRYYCVSCCYHHFWSSGIGKRHNQYSAPPDPKWTRSPQPKDSEL